MNAEHGAFVALNCTACHGEQGVSQAGLYPTLAGMDGAAIYKQLDDFRVGKRSWGAMNAIAQALSARDFADVFRRRRMPRAWLRASGPLAQLPSSPSDRRARGRATNRGILMLNRDAEIAAIAKLQRSSGSSPNLLVPAKVQ
jgi:cytochrome c553